MCSSLWICLWIVTFQGWNSYCDNAPPILKVPERTWELTDTELVDSIVTRVKADDDEDDPLVFGLEMKPALPGFPENLPLPLRIDNTTGVVYINDSLKGRAGESFSVYVTVTDGNIHAKTEVPVSIRGSGVSNGPYQKSSRPPRPGLASNYPPRGPPLFRPPGLNLSPPPPRPPRPTTDSTLLSVVTPTASREVPPSSVSPSTETPTTSTVTKVLTSTSPTPEGAPGGSNVTSTSAQEADLAVTVVPIVIVCALIGLGGLGAWLFRRRLFKYRMKTTTKDDLRKQSGSGGTILEDPMALQHWRGPRAHSNRYEGWDRETSSITQTPSSGPQPPGKLADRWEFPRHRLKVFNILGEGCFGQVWRCEAQDIDGNEGTSVVAVKTLKENANEKERSDLVQELQVMKMLEPHPNVVRLLGCCTEKDPLFVIMEFVPHGKLQSFLRSSRAERFYGNLHGPSKTLTSRDLTTFVYQVARGMEFLSAKGIIHRDLAARNVLVGENHVCKVADFGFARDVIANHVYERKSEGRLPIRWMAPESLYDNIFSVKSDVWTFGILIWEIVTLGSTPYPGLAAADVMKKVRDGYRLDKPEHCRRELYNIMYYCWDKDAKERPTFPELVQLLEQLLLSETEYIELERFPDHSYYNMVSLSGEKL